ncbi:MAG: hypothetical protein MK066_01465 [Crocinitomicaceae bacterium]|nr:hypothetical protein [Crocinitomicaceae bacterium]
MHVCDVAEAHVVGIEWLMKQTEKTHEVVNLGTGKGKSVLEIIDAFEEVSGKDLEWKMGRRRKGDMEQIFADTNKAKELLNWSSKRSVKDALKDAWNWEKKCMEMSAFKSYFFSGRVR